MPSMHLPRTLSLERGLALLRIGASATWAGRTVLLGRAVFYLLVITLLAAFWNLVAAERLPGTLASLLPTGGLAFYIGVTEWIVLSVPAIHLRLEDDIRSGAIEAHLLRPTSYPLSRVCEICGGLLVRQAVLGTAGLLGLILSGTGGLSPPMALCLIMLGVLGGIVGVLTYALVGMCAFWARRTTPIYMCVQKLSFLLGGLLAPLTLYPDWLRTIAEYSPFAAQLYWPATITLAPGAATVSHAMLMELLWITGLSMLLALIWRIGLQRVLREGV